MDITKYDEDIQKAINNFVLKVQEKKQELKEKLHKLDEELEQVKNEIAK